MELTTPENTITYHNALCLFSRETENNGYAKFWVDKQRALWYVVVFSGVVNCTHGAISMTSMFAARNTLRD